MGEAKEGGGKRGNGNIMTYITTTLISGERTEDKERGENVERDDRNTLMYWCIMVTTTGGKSSQPTTHAEMQTFQRRAWIC